MIFFLLTSILFALDVPSNLNAGEREQALKIIGLGTSSKILSIPYPLGGYAGFEVGLAYEALATDELAKLGSQIEEKSTFTYPTLSIGKGLTEKFDVFLHFIPFNDRSSLTEYGGIIRWNFYVPKTSPVHLSFLLHTNSSNINNQVITDSFGTELVASYQWNDFFVYAGIGQVKAKGRFVGGDNAITDSGVEEISRTEHVHKFIGASYHFLPYFIVMQVDEYETLVYSAKIGLRF